MFPVPNTPDTLLLQPQTATPKSPLVFPFTPTLTAPFEIPQCPTQHLTQLPLGVPNSVMPFRPSELSQLPLPIPDVNAEDPDVIAEIVSQACDNVIKCIDRLLWEIYDERHVSQTLRSLSRSPKLPKPKRQSRNVSFVKELASKFQIKLQIMVVVMMHLMFSFD